MTHYVVLSCAPACWQTSLPIGDLVLSRGREGPTSEELQAVASFNSYMLRNHSTGPVAYEPTAYEPPPRSVKYSCIVHENQGAENGEAYPVSATRVLKDYDSWTFGKPGKGASGGEPAAAAAGAVKPEAKRKPAKARAGAAAAAPAKKKRKQRQR